MVMLIVGAAVTLVVTIVVKVVELLVEGRGSWTRRAIAANVELLNALPKDLRAADGATALRARIDSDLVSLAAKGSVVPADGEPEDEPERVVRFEAEADALELRVVARLGVILATLSAFAVIGSLRELDRRGEGVSWVPVVAGLILGVPSARAAGKALERFARACVRRRWKKRGWQLPEHQRG